MLGVRSLWSRPLATACGRNLWRLQAAPMSSAALTFASHGQPQDVLQLQQPQLPPLGNSSVHIQMLMAPINPSDINTIQGKYPITPPLPGVPGHEGVGRVQAVGDKVTHLKPGDLVVPVAPAVGTWRTQGIWPAADWHAVPADLKPEAAATLCINPPSALSMLEQFEELSPGDAVVQNGATSAVGQAVIQLAKAKGLKTVNVIRDRPDWDETVAWLKGMGADIVTTEASLKSDMAAAGIKSARLGLNCVGGSAATAVAKVLSEGGTLVTYGAMSMQPLTLPTGLLIFKGIQFKGFWLSGGWAKKAGPEARGRLLDQLAQYNLKGQLHPPKLKLYRLQDFHEALRENEAGFRHHKIAFALEG